MCGRIIQYRDIEELLRIFAVDENRFGTKREREYNVPPSTRIPAIQTRDGERVLDGFHWGFPLDEGKRLVINARAEGIESKPLFRGPVRASRIVVPADGFYEWRAEGKRRQPYLLRRADGDPMALAGLSRRGTLKDGTETDCAVIVTTGANGPVARIHDRMPVLLDAGGVDTWLASDGLDKAALGALLAPAPDDVLDLVAVSTRVNRADEEDPQLIEPVETSY